MSIDTVCGSRHWRQMVSLTMMFEVMTCNLVATLDQMLLLMFRSYYSNAFVLTQDRPYGIVCTMSTMHRQFLYVMESECRWWVKSNYFTHGILLKFRSRIYYYYVQIKAKHFYLNELLLYFECSSGRYLKFMGA